jgi:AcrR family transcriptional regulator
MRRLAAELAVMPNALYTYFADKDALLDALLDAVLGDIDTGNPAEEDWRDGLVNLMDSSRRLLLAHPQLVPVFLSRPTLGPNAARLGEITFQLLRRGGLEGERAVEAFWVLLIYSLGFAAFQAPRLQDDAAARTERGEATFGSLPQEGFPEMRRVATHLSRHPTDGNFHTGLSWLLEGISSRAYRET